MFSVTKVRYCIKTRKYYDSFLLIKLIFCYRNN